MIASLLLIASLLPICIGGPARAADGTHRIMIGFYPPVVPDSVARRFAERRHRWHEDRLTVEELGCAPALAATYISLNTPFRPDRMRRWWRTTPGTVHVLGWELWKWGPGERDSSQVPAIVAGRYDAFFRNWARGLRDLREPVFLRFGFEMNGNWFTWGGRDPKAYKAAWRHVHSLFVEEGATNVIWVWCPNVKSIPEVSRAPWNDMHNYYPGGDVVDWVGVDGYNWGASSDANGHRWCSFDELLGPVLRDFARRYPDKPQMVGEFACANDDGGSKAAWIRDAFDSMRNYPLLGAAVWFNEDKERDWRVDATPETLAAMRSALTDPWIASSYDAWLASGRPAQK